MQALSFIETPPRRPEEAQDLLHDIPLLQDVHRRMVGRPFRSAAQVVAGTRLTEFIQAVLDAEPEQAIVHLHPFDEHAVLLLKTHPERDGVTILQFDRIVEGPPPPRPGAQVRVCYQWNNVRTGLPVVMDTLFQYVERTPSLLTVFLRDGRPLAVDPTGLFAKRARQEDRFPDILLTKDDAPFVLINPVADSMVAHDPPRGEPPTDGELLAAMYKIPMDRLM